jgi:hypothetical protein
MAKADLPAFTVSLLFTCIPMTTNSHPSNTRKAWPPTGQHKETRLLLTSKAIKQLSSTDRAFQQGLSISAAGALCSSFNSQTRSESNDLPSQGSKAMSASNRPATKVTRPDTTIKPAEALKAPLSIAQVAGLPSKSQADQSNQSKHHQRRPANNYQ